MKYLMMVEKEFPKSNCYVIFEKREGVGYVIAVRVNDCVNDFRAYAKINLLELKETKGSAEEWAEREIGNMIGEIRDKKSWEGCVSP